MLGHALRVKSYHEDVDEVARGGVPDLQRQVVGSGDHGAVMAIPRYHGNLQLGHLVFQRRRIVLPGKGRVGGVSDDVEMRIRISLTKREKGREGKREKHRRSRTAGQSQQLIICISCQ